MKYTAQPLWMPDQDTQKTANINELMTALTIKTVADLHSWSVTHYEDFWQYVIKKLNIIFKKAPASICDLSNGIESPQWFPQALMNITDSCFHAPSHAIAIVYPDANKKIKQITYAELNDLSNQVANSLVAKGFKTGDAIGIAMPMHYHAVAIYLGIIKMGGIVVSIADSFSSDEIALRLHIAKAKAIFTQDDISWDNKTLPLYEKIKKINVPAIVLANKEKLSVSLREIDFDWPAFLNTNKNFVSVALSPMTPCNILFSSGTTAEPKAIIWNQTTPIKAASDAFFHQNIKAGDILLWPTNLGWMMGPWLIFAAFINQATLALYPDAPKNRTLGEFIANAKVTMIGVVPTLVATWRQSKCMENLDWHHIKIFTSTGECSNADDMTYLSSLAGGKPIIEYCGGTEIGGAYISSTVIENNYPALFTTPTLGLDFTILDEAGKSATIGEVAIMPPSIGLSTELLNANHHDVYYVDMPKTTDGKILRRHGDQIEQLPNGLFSILGRSDDTMNLGGIKISSAEIERAIMPIPNIIEVAAISVASAHGPTQLVIYAATDAQLEKADLKKIMQQKINSKLNPLFKIHDVVFIKNLPKTASNKIMRRVLRKEYQESN